jgi:glycerate 2-kinase
MLIKNFKKLASTQERKIALKIANAGLEAIDPLKVIQSNIDLKKNILTIKKKKFDISEVENIYVLGIGKASFRACQALEEILKDKIRDGALIDTKKGKLKRIKVFKGTHPLPSQKNIQASQKISAIAQKATEKDLILFLVSGGGSALFSLPQKATVSQVKNLTDELLKSGADILKINTVRKHLSQVKGGGLAKLAYPAKLVSLIFSDVPGDDISFIASGPTVKDKTTKKEAQKILDKYNISPLKLYETPKESKYFKNVSNILLLSGKTALKGMQKECHKLKIPCSVYSYALKGEARIVGRKILQRVKGSGALIATGETTVKVEGSGKGGRNQELVLGALPYLEKTVFISIASDGLDNTEAAGAIGDDNSLKEAQEKGLAWSEYMRDNDAFSFFKELDDLIMTGPTGSNVADLIVIYNK